AANLVSGFVTGNAFARTDNGVRPLYATIMDGYNENGMAGGLSAYVARFMAGQMVQGAKVVAYNGSTSLQELALDSVLAADKYDATFYGAFPGSAPEIIMPEVTETEWRTVQNNKDIQEQLQKINDQIITADEQAIGQIATFDAAGFDAKWNAIANNLPQEEQSLGNDLMNVDREIQSASLAIGSGDVMLSYPNYQSALH